LKDHWNAVILGGYSSNTFTGTTIVSGKGIILSLDKKNGATAIQGDVWLEEGTGLTFWRGDQIADSATVTMSEGVCLNLHQAVHERIHRVVVRGDSTIRFGSALDNRFYLNDLLIADDSVLTISGWKEGRDALLVRKDSEHLWDALSRIYFEGRKEHRAWVEDYDKDYWEIIPAFPESATYGALFGAVGLIVAWCRQRREQKSRESQCSGLT